MDGLLYAALILALAGHSSATWCVCKDGVGDATLQKTLDYACGAGADCNPIHQNAACYNPNTLKAHCNYAVNSFFQKKGQSQGSCDFAGTASVTTSDPNHHHSRASHRRASHHHRRAPPSLRTTTAVHRRASHRHIATLIHSLSLDEPRPPQNR